MSALLSIRGLVAAYGNIEALKASISTSTPARSSP
jgi:hypothetical protein